MPETTDADVELAEREAAEAAELVALLEEAAVYEEPEKRPSAADMAEARHLAEFAHKRVEVTAQRAQEARAARRLAALEELGADIDKLAAEASGSTVMSTALAAVAEAAAAFREVCREHDGKVLQLGQRAAGLGSEPADGAGPRASSAYVLRGGGNVSSGDGHITHGSVTVKPVGDVRTAQAIDRAVAGDMAGALKLAETVTDRSRQRYDHYFEFPDGSVHPANGTPGPNFRGMRELTAAEVDVYLKQKESR